ncbi:MAG: Rne/Rng family ribonuclease [Blastocatellia bacterium]|nr:Rne/Rng family ribonuclease [Blastocatellia bacterium]
MSVRRGGRGRRRGGRGRKPETGEGGSEAPVGFEDVASEPSPDGPAAAIAEEKKAAEPIEEKPDKAAAEGRPESSEDGDEQAKDDQKGDQRGGRGRGGRGGGARTQQARGGRGDSRPENRDSRDNRGDGREDRKGGAPTISDLLREGQEILVQIAKEPIAKKGARITSHIALPGRFLVYMPTIEHLGVSRKIESSNERARLRAFIQRIRQDEEIPSGGFIVRTAGVGISEEDLRQDARYLVRTWVDIRKQSEKAKSPALVHQDLDLVQRLLRDQLSDEFTAIRVDSEEEYLRTVEFINRIQPRMVKRIKLYTRETPILEAYGVQEEVDKALKPRVWLKSGGYLVINQTEALVAIDVNTGKFVGKGNARLEDTITRTNMEAVDEIARQIRLRDLGGIIVLDLIDMEDRRNRHKVSQALQEALASDKSPNKVLSFNDFGLIIMTRKRVKQSLERTMCSPCEYCEGAGWIKSATTICYEILSEARRLSKELDDVRQTTLRIHPEVSKALRSTERAVLDEIEAYIGNVDITSDASIHQAQFDFAFI